MPVTRLIKDVLAGRAAAGFVGREHELRLLTECADGRGPVLAWIHGLAWIGKSSLLQEFSARATASGSSIIRLDCRFIEPTPEGFLLELQRVLNRPVSTIDAVNDALSSFTRAVLVLDSYEVLRLLDGWLRQAFFPALKETVRVVICGRYGPAPHRRSALEWQGLMLTIPLSPLTEPESLALLERAGIMASDATAIYRIARGHPMALMLVGSARSNMSWNRDTTDSHSLVRQLTQLYLTDVIDANLRTAVEAASVLRRTTQSILAALLPEIYSRGLYEELAALSIVEVTSEGLMIHEQVQEAVSSWLRSSDPHRFSTYRRAAWRQVRAESCQADGSDRWRYTAEMLYLVQNPGLREAFFPAGVQSLCVERALPCDQDSILAIAHTHEVPLAAAAITQWWQSVPDSFYVMRDASGEIAGFYTAADLRILRGRMPAADPAVAQMQRHLQQNPLTQGETALFLRRWLSKSAGESPSPVQAACWLDVKRSHMALRPHIRRCYGSVIDGDTFAPMVQSIGFRVVDNGLASIDGAPWQVLMLDFGPGSFDGWLSDLVGRELGLKNEEILDVAARELVNDEERVGLTVLEFGVLTYLRVREGKAVSRAELLEHVWEQRANSGSNVVDVVVRSLRSKLGVRAWIISTVWGIGYRFRSNPPE